MRRSRVRVPLSARQTIETNRATKSFVARFVSIHWTPTGIYPIQHYIHPFLHSPSIQRNHLKGKRSWITSEPFVHPQGLEPWTHWLRVNCSTNWAKSASPFQLRCKGTSLFWTCKFFFSFFSKKNIFHHFQCTFSVHTIPYSLHHKPYTTFHRKTFNFS